MTNSNAVRGVQIQMPGAPSKQWGSADFRRVFYNQYVCFMGDSIQRGMYKDFVKLFHNDQELDDREQKRKGEPSFYNDRAIRVSELTNGKEFEEIRVFQKDTHIFKFFFLTKVYSDYMESVVFPDLKQCPPDIIIINSCVWDITRYGPQAISEYKLSLERLFTRLRLEQVVPPSTEIIWLTTLPLGPEVRGGFIVQVIRFMDCQRLRLDILEANRWIADNVAEYYDINVLDLHFMLAPYQDHRKADGIHWDGWAHRYMTSAICEFVEYLNTRCRREEGGQSQGGPASTKDQFLEQKWDFDKPTNTAAPPLRQQGSTAMRLLPQSPLLIQQQQKPQLPPLQPQFQFEPLMPKPQAPPEVLPKYVPVRSSPTPTFYDQPRGAPVPPSIGMVPGLRYSAPYRPAPPPPPPPGPLPPMQPLPVPYRRPSDRLVPAYYPGVPRPPLSSFNSVGYYGTSIPANSQQEFSTAYQQTFDNRPLNQPFWSNPRYPYPPGGRGGGY